MKINFLKSLEIDTNDDIYLIRKNLKLMRKIDKKLNSLIPGGAHTYSRGFDQFPDNSPQILKSGKGVYVFDEKNNKYIDYGMGLRSVILGYANKKLIKPQ